MHGHLLHEQRQAAGTLPDGGGGLVQELGGRRGALEHLLHYPRRLLRRERLQPQPQRTLARCQVLQTSHQLSYLNPKHAASMASVIDSESGSFVSQLGKLILSLWTLIMNLWLCKFWSYGKEC